MSADFAEWLNKPACVVGRVWQPVSYLNFNMPARFVVTALGEGSFRFMRVGDSKPVYDYPYRVVDGVSQCQEAGIWYSMRWLL